jgi:hypothetical protein
MKLKFHQTLPSDAPEYPFRAGQVIEIAKPTKAMLGWIKRGWAEVLKDEPERAVIPDRQEHAVTGRK